MSKAVQAILILLAVLVLGAPAQGKTLRWSSQGDLLTMDPHSTNENLTTSLNGQVYETLVDLDKQMNLGSRLALSWQLVNNTTWLFKLRPGVRFHDGSPFTADDVVFSVKRARQPTSLVRIYATALGEPTKIDKLTVQFTQDQPNPILLAYLSNVQIMSKTWCEQPNATRPLDRMNKEETFAARHVNGTGPYMLKSREEDVKTVYVENPDWWGRREKQRDRNRLPADQERGHPDRGPHVQRSGLRPGPAGTGHPSAEVKPTAQSRRRS
jgi:peptide/nickel transport system substrate-binding protein